MPPTEAEIQQIRERANARVVKDVPTWADVRLLLSALTEAKEENERLLKQASEWKATALATQRAQMVGEVERMRDKWKAQVERDTSRKRPVLGRINDERLYAAEQILFRLCALQPTEKQESENIR